MTYTFVWRAAIAANSRRRLSHIASSIEVRGLPCGVYFHRRCFSPRRAQEPDSGSRTLEAVVRELRRGGKLNTDEATATPGMVDIDAILAEGVEQEGESEYEDDLRGGTFSDRFEEDFSDSCESDASTRKAMVSARDFDEDVTLLSEEELRDRVRRSIEELVPQSTAMAFEENNLRDSRVEHSSENRHGEDSYDNEHLTPAQIFYLENRDRLVNRAQDYYLEKRREQLEQRDAPEEVEDEWRFYHDPVVRPGKGHLWSTGTKGEDDQHGSEYGWTLAVAKWPKGCMPTPEMLAELLRREQARDVHVVDLYDCGRHDVGTHGIVATGITSLHCRRLGDIVARATQYCEPPHVEAFCYGTRNDEWVVAHCGPIKVHIFTRETRSEYQLELLWNRPEDFFLPGDFPHYIEIYGTASDAFIDEHIVQSTGTRSRAQIPPPFRDAAHPAFMLHDYEAAEDAQYTSTRPRVLGTSGTIDATGIVADTEDHHGTDALTDDEHDIETDTDDDDTDAGDKNYGNPYMVGDNGNSTAISDSIVGSGHK